MIYIVFNIFTARSQGIREILSVSLYETVYFLQLSFTCSTDTAQYQSFTFTLINVGCLNNVFYSFI